MADEKFCFKIVNYIIYIPNGGYICIEMAGKFLLKWSIKMEGKFCNEINNGMLVSSKSRPTC